jgi:putative ABC transport system permease protein
VLPFQKIKNKVMIKNYFKIAFRNLYRNKAFSAINIVGLSTGLTCCLLMILYLQHQLSFDTFHEKGHRIVRVIMEYSFGEDRSSKGNFTSTKVLPSFKQNFPEVADGVRLSPSKALVRYGDNVFNEKYFLYADSTFFNIFSFKLLQGNPKQVLNAPKTLVITQSMARKYFGEENPVGKSLLLGSTLMPYQVTGVVEDCPANSQLKFDFICPFSTLGQSQERTYFEANFTTYLLLNSEKAIASLQSKIPNFMKNEMEKEAGNRNSAYVNYELEPLTKIHIHSKFDAIVPNINIKYIYIIGIIALLVLIIACFTYINLSTARSIERAKEVGVRKVTGAYQHQIFWQFISESFVMTIASMLISLGFTALLLPAFNQLAKTDLLFVSIGQPTIVLSALFLILTIALLAGSYPAFVLSNFQPIKVLKGAFKTPNSGIGLRQSLIVFQFVVSVFLIIATIVINSQLHFIQNKNLGYDREHVLLMNLDKKMIDKIDRVKTELKTNPDILAVSKAHESPVEIKGGYSMRASEWADDKDVSVRANPIDDEYIQATGLKLIAGGNINRQDILEASNEGFEKNFYHFILNTSATTALGWKPEEAIGKKVELGGRKGAVRGVVEDFHFTSLHSAIEPLILFPGDWATTLLVKTKGQNIAQTIDFVGKKWKELSPQRPFEYRFMDEDYQKMYDSEARIGQVFNVFSAIAIILACLGLFGLSAYAIKQRVKEIGIRKVLGASVSHIVTLLSTDFIKLVLIAVAIAAPIAWWAASKWLQDFVYRINIGWWIFALAGGLALLIALLTVSFQAVKAAVANPVKSLRTE